MMKRKYAAFSYCEYEAVGGMSDFIGSFNSPDEAKRAVEKGHGTTGDVAVIEDNDVKEGWSMTSKFNARTREYEFLWRRWGND